MGAMVLSDRYSPVKTPNRSEKTIQSTLEQENWFNWLTDTEEVSVEKSSASKPPSQDLRSLENPPSESSESQSSVDQTLNLLCDLLLENPPPQYEREARFSGELPPLVLKAELVIPESTPSPISTPAAISKPQLQIAPIKSEDQPESQISLEALQSLLFQEGETQKTAPELKQKPASKEGKLLKKDPGSLTVSSENMTVEERLRVLEQQTALLNPMLPLISELLGFDLTVSHEQSIRVLTPIIDKIIQNRAQQDAEAMSGVLADLIPAAISEEIRRSPREVAKALAPEVSLAIEEQIRLDRHAIAKALGPEMGPAIKQQIEHEREAMVDALYPVIGNTIAKYMGDVIQSINQKVESALTLRGIQRKIKARVRGVSEAELIFQESMPFQVTAIFLIHKASGLVISEFQPAQEERLESEMLAGMLTAIRSFVNDCVSSSESASELNEIEYDDCKIILEVAGYSYMAVVIKGEPSKAFLQKIKDTYGLLLQKFGETIAEFDGDSGTIPHQVPDSLEKLFGESEKKIDDEFPWALTILILGIIAAIAIPWIWTSYRWKAEHRLENQARQALLATPELSVYALTPDVKQNTIHLKGRVPNEYLRLKAGEIITQTLPELTLDNDIIAVNLPPDLDASASEVGRIVKVLNQLDGVAIAATYEQGHVTVSGTVVEVRDLEKILDSLQGITGVSSVFSRIKLQQSPLEMKIYFESGSNQLHPADRAENIPKIAQFLKQYPEFNLMIIGHSDRLGNWGENQKLSLQRAKIVKGALQQEGIQATRLHIQGTTEPPPGINSTDALALSRSVRFELFRPIQVGK